MARPVGMKSGNRRHAIDGNPTSRGEKGVEKDRERVAGEAETGKAKRTGKFCDQSKAYSDS
jgi:hypothetical protein